MSSNMCVFCFGKYLSEINIPNGSNKCIHQNINWLPCEECDKEFNKIKEKCKNNENLDHKLKNFKNKGEKMYKSHNINDNNKLNKQKELLVNEIRDNLKMTVYEFYKLQNIVSFGTLRNVICSRMYKSISIDKLIKLRDLSIEILKKENE